MWFIDPYHERLSERSFNIPEGMSHLLGFNDPKRHKHKSPKNLSSSSLQSVSLQLEQLLDKPWLLSGQYWSHVYETLQNLSNSLLGYLRYLNSKTVPAPEPIPHELGNEKSNITILYPSHVVKPAFLCRYKKLCDKLKTSEYFESILVDEFTPDDTLSRRYYLNNMGKAMQVKCVHLRIASKNNFGTRHFLWKVTPLMDETDLLRQNSKLIRSIAADMPKFEKKIIRMEF